MITTVINILGSPGAGKTTVASEVFTKMKWLGMDVELVSEYAKELVWEERNETFKNELYLFAKQHHRMFRLNGKVKYIITDRPLILSLFYNERYGDGADVFKNIVLHEVKKFNNVNIFLKRNGEYITKGRKQTEEESDQFSKEMYDMLRKHKSIDHLFTTTENTTATDILDIIMNPKTPF